MLRYTQIMLLLSVLRDQLEYNTLKYSGFNYNNLISTCYVNLLSNSPLYFRNGELLFSLYFRYYTQTFFVTRLIINQINKVQWVDFKLENFLVFLHFLKTMGLGSIIFKEWRVITRTFSYA